MSSPIQISLPPRDRRDSASTSSDVTSTSYTSEEKQAPSAQGFEPKIDKLERDRKQVTVEGYKTLGLASTFIAGVEGQCLGMVSDVKDSEPSKLREVAIAFLLTGLLLSSFGAALSLLSARWFDLLRGDQVVKLEWRWACARTGRNKNDLEKLERPTPEIEGPEPWNLRDWLVAKAIAYTLLLVFCGFYAFIIGMVLYTWDVHRLVIAIVNTVVAVFGTILLVLMHLDFNFMGTLDHVSFERIRI